MATAAEAPLEDKFSAERQRFLWSQGPSTKELDDQSDKVNSLENQVNDLEQLLEELKQADGRTREERNTGEPPHPPWRRIEQVKQEIESIRDDLSVEKQLLKASEREKR
jgi:archaellum component FlaC